MSARTQAEPAGRHDAELNERGQVRSVCVAHWGRLRLPSVRPAADLVRPVPAERSAVGDAGRAGRRQRLRAIRWSTGPVGPRWARRARRSAVSEVEIIRSRRRRSGSN